MPPHTIKSPNAPAVAPKALPNNWPNSNCCPRWFASPSPFWVGWPPLRQRLERSCPQS